jgi:hypothetical protein
LIKISGCGLKSAGMDAVLQAVIGAGPLAVLHASTTYVPASAVFGTTEASVTARLTVSALMTFLDVRCKTSPPSAGEESPADALE